MAEEIQQDFPELTNANFIRFLYNEVTMTQSYFFALFPNPHSRREIVDAADEFAKHFNLNGSPINPAKLHLPIYFIGGFDSPEANEVAIAIQRADESGKYPFNIVLDRACSFLNSRGETSLAFISSKSSDPPLEIESLHYWLQGNIAKCFGIDKHWTSFTPRICVRENCNSIKARVKIKPIVLKPTRFVLARSTPDHSAYETIRTWPLNRRKVFYSKRKKARRI